MHLTPSWVHVRFTDPYGLFATDSDEHYDSLCDMGSLLKLPHHEEVREVDHLCEVLDEWNRWLAHVDERIREVQKERDSLHRDLDNTWQELENARQEQVLKMHTPPPHAIKDASTSATVAFSPSHS